eukprot:TRINITY_DN167_c0_g1_i1.p1 TRINITY_DN167_c0_g1~~TRINITY_DN167_c0_g1_i1.p1  ORF type:complete len:182 (-),score=28.12 TRINITY_DN167_c0_g1_i1:167-712(-)
MCIRDSINAEYMGITFKLPLQMGKETLCEQKVPLSVFTHKLSVPAKSSIKEVANEWAINERIITQSQVFCDGEVEVTIRNNGEDMCLNLHGFSNQNNKSILLIGRLLQKGILTPETNIKSYLINKNAMWCSLDIKSSTFNSGDSLMFVICDKIMNQKGQSNKMKLSESIQSRSKGIKKITL